MARRQACIYEPFIASWKKLKAVLLTIYFHGGHGQDVGNEHSLSPLLQRGGSSG